MTNNKPLSKSPSYLALTCEALARTVYAAAANAKPVITVQLYRQGLHNTPKNLRATLQDALDAVPADTYDAILLVYGLCGNSTVGLTARHTPIVIPRAHDCITLYLGSRQRYQQEFDAHPGTYWYSLDYMERNEPGSNVALGAANLGALDDVYDEYVEKYGKDNADYLMEVMGEWGKHYDRAVYIDMGSGDGQAYEQMARDEAERRQWLFERQQGNRRLLEMLIKGDWPEDEFLIIPPGHTLITSGDDGLMQAQPVEG
jgi:hypothetical protein